MCPSDLNDNQLQEVLFEAMMNKDYDQGFYLELVAEMDKRRLIGHA